MMDDPVKAADRLFEQFEEGVVIAIGEEDVAAVMAAIVTCQTAPA